MTRLWAGVHGPVKRLTDRESELLIRALSVQVSWGVSGMFGDGSDIVEKIDLRMAKRLLSKLDTAGKTDKRPACIYEHPHVGPCEFHD